MIFWECYSAFTDCLKVISYFFAHLQQYPYRFSLLYCIVFQTQYFNLCIFLICLVFTLWHKQIKEFYICSKCDLCWLTMCLKCNEAERVSLHWAYSLECNVDEDNQTYFLALGNCITTEFDTLKTYKRANVKWQ